MPHRKIPILLSILSVFALSTAATDFWISKDWHQWSKPECATLLSESPWVQTWRPALLSTDCIRLDWRKGGSQHG